MIRTDNVRRQAAALRRICSKASFAAMVPDHLPHDPPLVGDLPDFVFIRIAAWHSASTLEFKLKEWIAQGGHIVGY